MGIAIFGVDEGQSICTKLLDAGQDTSCYNISKKKYFQQLVLVNKLDVESYNIYTEHPKNRINFNLLSGKTGFSFLGSDKKANYNAKFSKKKAKGIVTYDHKMDFPVVGITEVDKVLLRKLDLSNYFGSIQYSDGTVEIFGFTNGLETNGYSFESQSTLGGSIISLSSISGEFFPPYIYVPKFLVGGNSPHEQANEDFDNLFGEIPNQNTGDYNNDFNDDFNIT